MEIASENLENGVIRIVLTGRLDMQGAQEIDMKFTALAATKAAPVIVDMSGVSFMASLGLRTLLSSAKAVAKRGGKMVIYSPQPNVIEVLKVSGVSNLIPIKDDLPSALAEVLS
ncbi:MAG TPA: anti-sigma factor antagonist [Methylophilaceae bacterium]|nr:anti-sigma factor antagonist [Methylophilaceae bacterium]